MALEADAWRAACFPVQKHGSNLPPALSHLLLFIAVGRTSAQQEPEMSPTQERMLEPRGDVWETAGQVLFLTSLASPFAGAV